MQQRRVRLGDILDDYCPRERRITNHAVVAMIDDEVKQTRCTTCQSDHEYKAAKTPPPRRRKTGALSGEDAEGVIRPRPVSPSSGEPEPDDIQPAEESLDALPDVDADADTEADTETQPEAVFADADTGTSESETGSEGDEDAPADQDEWPVHRPLIRATLPRPEGQVPERKPTDFTFRPGGTGTARFDQNNRNGKRRGHRPMRQGQGQGQPQGQNRFGPPRQGSGQPGQRAPQGQRQGGGNRQGQGPGPGGGGRPGQGRGPRQGSGPGRKRGR